MLQDVLTLDGSQFKDATVIVASPPCQAYSYRAMPWKRAKTLPPPDNTLFEACFRIQREASEAAGRHVPMVVENVKGAQPWVGRARWHYGSFYLWGDVPALMPIAKGQKFNPDGTSHGQGSWFAIADSKNRGSRKNDGGSWFAAAHNTDSGHSRNPVNGRKGPGGDWFKDGRQGQDACAEGIKQGGEWWHDTNGIRQYSSRSAARKHASALIAKIPFPLARHIARVYRPG